MAKRIYTDEQRKERRKIASRKYADSTIAQREANREVRLAQRKAYREANKIKLAAYQKEYVARNRARLAFNKQAKRQDPTYQAQERAAYRRWFTENRHLDSAKQHRRRANYIRAIPAWFSELDELVMLEASELCRQRETLTGFKWQIDHIVPLVSKKVCGLHIGCNIQVIPAAENQSKGNRYWPDMA